MLASAVTCGNDGFCLAAEPAWPPETLPLSRGDAAPWADVAGWWRSVALEDWEAVAPLAIDREVLLLPVRRCPRWLQRRDGP